MAAPDWRDEKAAEAMGVQEREKVVADYVRAKCRDRTSTFDVEEVTDMVRIYGLKSLFRLLDEGLQSEVGRRGVLTNTAYACMHTAGMRCSQADEKNGEKLYQAHGKYMDEYLRGTVLPALNKLSGPPLLREFKRRWENHKIFTEWMRKLFLYLDRRGAYVGNFQQSTLTSKGIALFKEVVFDGKKGDLVDTIQIIANQEREGEQIDRALLRSVIELFLVMGISEVRDFKDIRDVKARAKDESAGSSSTYRDDFEAPFLRNTIEYYNAKAVEWFAVDTTPEYLAKCEAALIADQERVLAYLNPVTKPKLEGVIRDVLVKDRLGDLLNKPGSGARELLRDDRQEDLGRMYRMFRLVDGGLREFGLVFRAYLKERGAVIMDRRKDESTARLEAKKDPGTLDIPFVEDILALYDKYEASVKGVFEGNATFQEEFKNAWTHTMNSSAGPITLSQLLASYMDSVLRDSKAAESEQTHKMKECAKLTEYLDSKDIFQLYYEKLLCDRLLNEQTTSNDVENNTITFFKESKGAAFTAKMEGMVSDLVTTSANLSLFQDPFEEWARQEVAEGRHRILFTPTILCRGHWPQFPDLPGIQPVDDFARVAGVFDEFYKKQYSGGRKVTWEWARGKAELHVFLVDKAGNPDRKTVNMSMVQAFACLKFNSSPTFTRKALATELGLTEDVLDKVVKPMVSRGKKLPNGKVKKIPGLFKFKTDKATKAVTYTFNAGYTNPRREVEISVPNLTTSKAADSKRIDKGREFQLDAAIVRIMKTRQTSSHTELVAEVVKAIRLFRPQPADIKKRIESLIQKEFIERDEDDRKLYHYMA